MMERLLYVSRAAPGIGPREVFDLVRRAHNRNSQLGLTGALLTLDGCFVQVLEGQSASVRERIARIAADPRHRDLEVRLQVQVTERAFPNDWMALRLRDELEPALLQRFGYEPGLPAERFDGARLLQFVQACCAVVAARA